MSARTVIIWVGVFIFYIVLPSSLFASELIINEFLPAPSNSSLNPEWVEFYNMSSPSVDLSDYYFDDDANFDSDNGNSAKIALSGILPQVEKCYWNLPSYLNNNGDTPTLFKLDGSIIDSYIYTQTSSDKSFARIPDGGDWQSNQDPTKPSINCLDLTPPTPTSTPTSAPTPTNTPTSAPTNTQIPTKTPTSTATPTIKPTLTASPTAMPTVELISTIVPSPTGAVLGDQDTEVSKNKKYIIALLFISVGCALMAAVFVIKNRLYLKK